MPRAVPKGRGINIPRLRFLKAGVGPDPLMLRSARCREPIGDADPQHLIPLRRPTMRSGTPVFATAHNTKPRRASTPREPCARGAFLAHIIQQATAQAMASEAPGLWKATLPLPPLEQKASRGLAEHGDRPRRHLRAPGTKHSWAAAVAS